MKVVVLVEIIGKDLWPSGGDISNGEGHTDITIPIA